jgi:Spy/CpxP family protein refolding chaperone
MLKQTPGWAIATVVAVFVAGGLVGWGASAHGGHWRRGDGRGFGGPFGPGGHFPLTRELDLSPAQEDSVRAILERHRPAMEAIWRAVRPRFDSVRAAVNTEISAQLTPAQRPRFAELMRRFDDRLRREPPHPGP